MSEFIYDKIFILAKDQTLPDQEAAFAVAAANAASDLKIVNVPSLDDVAREEKGDFYTTATEPKQSENLICATVGVAWFTDDLGRKHIRVIGAAVKLKSWRMNRLWPSNLQPPLLVYPGISVDHRGFYLTCKCGREITCVNPQWNGRNCEVCQEAEEYVRDNGCEVYFPAKKKRQP